MKLTLTSIQQRVFGFVIYYKSNHDGNSPTIRDIVVGADVSSTSVVRHSLLALQRKGLLTYDKGAVSIDGGRWRAGFHGEERKTLMRDCVNLIRP